MGVFATHAPVYADAGLAVFPVDTRNKRPAVRNWQRAGRSASRAWIEKFPAADGIGLCVGQRSGLVEIDVDMVGDAALAAAVERFGDSPVKIRTASGKSKLWYRHSGEGRSIRAIEGLPIDVLGDGFTIAPPSRRGDLGTSYEFLSGGLSDIANLPTMRADALHAGAQTLAAETVRSGQRNRSLFQWCMVEGRHCDDAEALIDAAITWCGAMIDPLPRHEVERTARSAWKYEAAGRNFVGLRKPQVTEGDVMMDHLLDAPDAYVLLAMFRRYHGNRQSFAIAPRAMSNAGTPPWHWSRISKARDVLVERECLEVVAAPRVGKRRAGQYRLSAKWSDSVHNHYTPLPPSQGQLEGGARHG